MSRLTLPGPGDFIAALADRLADSANRAAAQADKAAALLARIDRHDAARKRSLIEAADAIGDVANAAAERVA